MLNDAVTKSNILMNSIEERIGKMKGVLEIKSKL